MEELKTFRLKCALREIKTGKTKGVKEIYIKGTYGNDAVQRFRNELRKEGLYTLDEDYSYMEMPSGF